MDGGPLSKKYEREMENDFLAHPFNKPNQLRKFVTFFPLSQRTKHIAQRKLRELASELHASSELDAIVEKNLKSTATLLIGFREWTPAMLDKFLK